MDTETPSKTDVGLVLAAAFSPSHPAGPALRLALAAAVKLLDDFNESNKNSNNDMCIVPVDNNLSAVPNHQNSGAVLGSPHAESQITPLDFLCDEKVWKTLIHGKYLSIHDLGNLILCTSRRLSVSLVANEKQGNPTQQQQPQPHQPPYKAPALWRLLCEAYWDKELADRFLRATFWQGPLSPEMCFRLFATGNPSMSRRPWSRLKYSHMDYFLMVEMRCSRTGKVLCLEKIQGFRLCDFIEEGGTQDVPLSGGGVTVASFSAPQIHDMFPDKSIHCNWDEDTIIEDTDWEFTLFRKACVYDIRAYLVRHDKKILNLCSAKRVGEDINRRHSVDQKSEHSLHVHVENTQHPEGHDTASDALYSPMSSLIDAALPHNLRLRMWVSPDYRLVITNPQHFSSRGEDARCDFVISGLRLRTRTVVYPRNPLNVFPFAHVLELSEGWQENPY